MKFDEKRLPLFQEKTSQILFFLVLTASEFEREEWLLSIKSAIHEYLKTKNFDLNSRNANSHKTTKEVLISLVKKSPISSSAYLTSHILMNNDQNGNSENNNDIDSKTTTSTSLSPTGSEKLVRAQQYTGNLLCTLHKAHGFQSSCAPAVTVETDIYGHFETRARTAPALKPSDSPYWRDSTFEIELDGSSHLNILLYETASRNNQISRDTEILLCKAQLSISEILKKQGRHPYPLSGGIFLDITFEYTHREVLLKRSLSRKKNGTFGKPLSVICARDNRLLQHVNKSNNSNSNNNNEMTDNYVFEPPHLVKKCIAEIERRGLATQGIYRQNGPTQKIMHLRSLYESGRKTQADTVLVDSDIHCVAGLLKLYFRQLPQPLYPTELYADFIQTIKLTDESLKMKQMKENIERLQLQHEYHYQTLKRMLLHFNLVVKQETHNKMSSFNIATCFGPTLLWPDVNTNLESMDINTYTHDAHYQNEIVQFCIDNLGQLFGDNQIVSFQDHEGTINTEDQM